MTGEDLMLVYEEKWMPIMYSTEPIDREKAAEAVKEAYRIIEEKKPEIIFCNSLYEGAHLVISGDQSINQLSEEFGVNLYQQFCEQRHNYVDCLVPKQISLQLFAQLLRKLGSNSSNIPYDIFSNVEKILAPINYYLDSEYKHKYIDPIKMARYMAVCDFFFAELKCNNPNSINWQKLLFFTTHCGWIFPYKKVCIVCDRPRILSFDSQHRLHAEGSPAIQFADGYSLYSYHGVTLPEKYGKIYPNEWQPKWLLSEENAELKRVLIQGIGYDRIARELAAVELDTWQEYTLLKIDTNVDVEPIYLLKMTCPSTEFIHALRVPPDINSAREAIKWVNWGVDYEEFSVQT
ncbi:DUF6745 domain-containing protein [Microcoleus sp. D2_18a_D3]|uniref:DUF6745 domain-containing protein n=1 Tax=Microcoleus sp. D2_18a_D3 TaxID=3055330 RepID=UPI002FCFD054